MCTTIDIIWHSVAAIGILTVIAALGKFMFKCINMLT